MSPLGQKEFVELLVKFIIIAVESFCRYLHPFPTFKIKGLPPTKLHTLLLDHQSIKLSWFIDWPKKEVLFNVDDAFTDDTDWFAFGFSKRGEIEGSDVCYFLRNIYDEAFNEAIVSLFPLSVFFLIYYSRFFLQLHA